MDNSHVPKFGDWDSNDNIPYTAYFENARKGKSGLRMNPNDPEENPEAFMRDDYHEVYADVLSVRTASIPNNSQSLSSPENPHDIKHYDRRPSFGSSIENYKSIVSDISSGPSGNRQSYLDRSPPNSTRSSVRKYKKKSMADRGGTHSSSFSPSVQTHRRQHSGNQFSYDYMPMHQRPTSVPKFGDWDETNPKSGEGFTLIFGKVKEEKEIASSTLPTIPPQVGTYHNFQSKQGRGSSFKTKFCCLFPSAME